MPQKQKEEDFVVTDRRKFNLEGEALHPRTEEEPAAPEVKAAPVGTPEEEVVAVAPAKSLETSLGEAKLPEQDEAASPFEQFTPPTDEETAASQRAYSATAERMEDLMRANDPGGRREPPANFERLVQSFYFTAIVQLGLNTPQGQQVRVDLMGSKQTIDLLAVLAEKTKGNLTADEDKLLQSVLFELRMAFLEMTQALAQSAQQQAGAGAAGQHPKPKL